MHLHLFCKDQMMKMNFAKQKGFGLIELLIAILLSTVISIAIVQVFGRNKSSYIAHEDVSRLQENGRYAIQLLSKEVRASDYWGCTDSFDGVVSNVVGLAFPDPNTAGVGISGTEGAEVLGDDGYPSRPDSLQITGLRFTESYPLIVNHNVDDTQFQIQVPGNTGIQPNELLLAGKCGPTSAVVFQVTNDVDSTITGPAGNMVATVEHLSTPSAANPTTYSNAADVLDPGVFPARSSTVFRNLNFDNTYSIANDDPDNDVATPPVPSLMLSVAGGALQPIVPGVENMQIVYGEDIDGDEQADRYVNVDDVNDFENIMSVRISLLVRSPDANNTDPAPYTMEGITVDVDDIEPADNGLFHNRRVYTTTIALRNRTN
jgi:type IV pilus assembly protein PilW